MNAPFSARLARYLITDARVASLERMATICEASLRGGMTAIQLRAPGWTDLRLYEVAILLRELTNRYSALLIINDRADVASAVAADGVHLGVDDLPVLVARRLLGEGAVVGYSPESLADARQAVEDGASYLGVGPVYRTGTKGDAGEPIGLDGLHTIAANVAAPVIGVGGIDLENARAVLDAGAAGVAMVSAVFFADDPQRAACQLTKALA